MIKNYGIVMRLLALIAVSASVLAVVAFGQSNEQDEEDKEKRKRYVYEWIDDKGDIHITDDSGTIPEKYRDRAKKKFEAKTRPESEREGLEQKNTYPQPSVERGGISEESQRLQWRERIRSWKNRQADAEKRYRELEQKRAESVGRWGVLANAPPAVRAEYLRIEEEMRDVQRQIDEARNMIEVIIPEEARKAGIPPGWLRE